MQKEIEVKAAQNIELTKIVENYEYNLKVLGESNNANEKNIIELNNLVRD